MGFLVLSGSSGLLQQTVDAANPGTAPSNEEEHEAVQSSQLSVVQDVTALRELCFVEQTPVSQSTSSPKTHGQGN